jgi:hypothetical protein
MRGDGRGAAAAEGIAFGSVAYAEAQCLEDWIPVLRRFCRVTPPKRNRLGYPLRLTYAPGVDRARPISSYGEPWNHSALQNIHELRPCDVAVKIHRSKHIRQLFGRNVCHFPFVKPLVRYHIRPGIESQSISNIRPPSMEGIS